MAAAMAQHSRPRANSVPAITKRRPERKRSSTGPTNGATTANGTMVISRYSATWPRAWSTGRPNSSVPASDTVISASPALCAAVSSISRPSPVRPAPCACVSLRVAWPTPLPARTTPLAPACPARAA
ncbi:hypothetical protein GCM10009677_08600 [Sphaerisporangium rubeum]